MSRDEQPRFRITTWPHAVEVPAAVGVPKLLAVVDVQWPDEPDNQDWWIELDAKLGTFDRLDVVKDDDGSLAQIHIDRDLYRAAPEAVVGLRAIGRRVDWPPAAVFSSSEVELVDFPHELVLREFLEVDPDDLNDILRWCVRYGPLVPQRLYLLSEEFRPTIEPRVHTNRPLDEMVLYAGDEPDPTELEIELDDFPDRSGDSPESHEGTFWISKDRHTPLLGTAYGTALAAQQAHFTLYQTVVETWLRISADADLSREGLLAPPRQELADLWAGRGLPVAATTFDLLRTVQRLINVETVMAPRIEIAPPGAERDGLAFGRPVPRVMQAMMLQLVDLVAADVPAKQCANETCTTWFATQDGRAEYGQHRTKGVLYCSRSCARAQAQREYRRRKRD